MNLSNMEVIKIASLALSIAAKWFCSNNDCRENYEDETIMDVASDFYDYIKSSI